MHTIFSTALLLALSQAVEVLETVDIDFAYAEHLTKHGLSYESVEEFEVRKARFAEVDAIIRAHNSRDGVSYKRGHNRFSDWSHEELGINAAAVPAEGIKKKPLGDSSGTTKVFSSDNLASSLDWRSTDNVSKTVYD